MFRRPEWIEIVIAGISLVVLAYVNLPEVNARSAGLMRSEILVGSCLTALCVVGASTLQRKVHRAGLLLLHFFSYILLLTALAGSNLIAEILLLLLLELHVSLRLPLRPALATNGVVLAATTLVGLGSGAVDRVDVLLFGAIVLFLAELAVYYRERLVRASGTVELQSRSLENLAAANQSFVAHLESVEAESAERERLLITRELHDCVGYGMTNIAMMMNASRYLKDENPEKLVEYCQKTKELASSTLQETRQILYKLRAVSAQATPGAPLFFARLCRDFSEATGVRTDCHVGNLPSSVNERVFGTLFRAVQVGFINALRHGSTGHIVLGFWVTDAELCVRIWNDTPRGLSDPEAVGEGIGLKGIRERLDLVNGRLSYGPVPDGYQLTIMIPREETGIAAD